MHGPQRRRKPQTVALSDQRRRPPECYEAERRRNVGRREQRSEGREQPDHPRLNQKRRNQQRGHGHGGLLPRQASSKGEEKRNDAGRSEREERSSNQPSTAAKGTTMVGEFSAKARSLHPIKEHHRPQ